MPADPAAGERRHLTLEATSLNLIDQLEDVMWDLTGVHPAEDRLTTALDAIGEAREFIGRALIERLQTRHDEAVRAQVHRYHCRHLFGPTRRPRPIEP